MSRTGQCSVPVVVVLGGCPSAGSESLDRLSHECHLGPLCPGSPRPPICQPQTLGEAYKQHLVPETPMAPQGGHLWVESGPVPQTQGTASAHLCPPFTLGVMAPLPTAPQCQVLGAPPCKPPPCHQPPVFWNRGPCPPASHCTLPTALNPHPGGLVPKRPLPTSTGSCRGPEPPAAHNGRGPALAQSSSGLFK